MFEEFVQSRVRVFLLAPKLEESLFGTHYDVSCFLSLILV